MRRLLATLALPLALGGCSSGDTDQPDLAPGTDSVYSDQPLCSDVWVVGKVLPDGYNGCVADNLDQVAAVFTTCPAGEQFAYTTLDDTSYAIPGQVIVDRAGDVADLYADCQGEERVTSGN